VRSRLEKLVGGVFLSEIGIARLTHRLVTQRYRTGETIILKGVRGGFMGIVARGQVAVHSSLDQDSSRTMGNAAPNMLLLPGSTFGESMLVEGRASGSTLRAMTDVEIFVLRRTDYLAVASSRSSRPIYRIRLGRHWPALAALGLFVAALAVVIYFGVGFSLDRFGDDNGVVRLPTTAQASGAIQLVSPQNDHVVQEGQPLPVRAFLTESGFQQAVLHVDDRRQQVHVNPDRDAVSWEPNWTWEDTGAGAHVLTVLAQSSRGDWQTSLPVTVTVVPSGTLAFASNRDGAGAIYTMQSDGRAVERLANGPGDARYPVWRTGDMLSFVTESRPGQPVIRQFTVGEDETPILITGRDPTWTVDGSRLAYAVGVQGVSQVFRTSLDQSDPVQVTAEEAYAGQPSWSPDGTRLAYAAQRDGNWDIWIAPQDGGEPQQLTDDPAMDWAPAWSPDGARLAFVSNREGTHQVYVMRSSGGDLRRLTNFAQGSESPAWSPDGYWLAFVAYTGDGEGVNAREIHLMRADGQAQARLTYNAFDDSQPDWRKAP
jgi:WD40 repeat protein